MQHHRKITMHRDEDFDEELDGQGYNPADEEESEPTLSKTTEENYQKLFKRMVKQGQDRRWNGELGFRYPITYKEIVEDLLENKRQSKFSTLYKMRSALLHCMEGKVAEELKLYMRTTEFMEKLRMAGGLGNPESRPSGRSIPESDYHKILAKLNAGKKNAQATLIFLKATVATGARPIEWLNAVWVDRPKGKLRLLSAKAKIRNALNSISDETGRVFKEGEDAKSYRIVTVNKEDIDVVDQQVLAVRRLLNNSDTGFLYDEMPQELRAQCFEPFYNKCRITLYRASLKETGISYSFYDARSSFAANRRARDGIASASAELGHNAEKPDSNTAAHYANRYQAWSPYKQVNKANQNPAMLDQQNGSYIPVTFNLQVPKSG